ncbi:hypothetical protein NVSP9465_02880 [Novosphingobium sp. CECT 9465]|jgi:hypothetical protein|nr:hypothetical protein NVSP9465_02880 [Novosphingobium sp. CECT 9465]
MMPDASQWRSAARYEPVEDMTASALAWEWLRRNEGYNQDFEALSAKDADKTTLTDTIRQRWRLRFRGRPRDRSRYPTSVLDGAGRYQCRRSSRCA